MKTVLSWGMVVFLTVLLFGGAGIVSHCPIVFGMSGHAIALASAAVAGFLTLIVGPSILPRYFE